MSWFCVKPVCQSFRILGGAQSFVTLRAFSPFFHGIGTANRVTIPKRVRRLPYSKRLSRRRQCGQPYFSNPTTRSGRPLLVPHVPQRRVRARRRGCVGPF